jgi:hypothetical protein
MCSGSGGAGHEEDGGGRRGSIAELVGGRQRGQTEVRAWLQLLSPSLWLCAPAREREEPPPPPRARAAAGARRAWSLLKGAGRGGGGGGRAEQSAGSGAAMGAAGPRRPRRCPGRASRR